MSVSGIEKKLREHFGKSGVAEESAVVLNKKGEEFFVDVVRDGGYAVRQKADLNSIVKVWNLKKAAELIEGWEAKKEDILIPLDDVFGEEFDEIDDDFSGATEEEVEAAVGFIIDSDKKAEWALNKIRGEEQEFERLESIAKDQLEVINAKLVEINNSLAAAKKRKENRTNNLRWMLEQYFAKVPHKATKTGKKETYQLLSGKLTVTKKDPKPDVFNEEELVGWLKTSEAKQKFIKVTEKPMWGELKKTLSVSGLEFCDPESGEVVPGVKLIPQADEFKVEL